MKRISILTAGLCLCAQLSAAGLFTLPTAVAERGARTGIDLSNYGIDPDNGFEFKNHEILDLDLVGDTLYLRVPDNAVGFYPVEWSVNGDPHILMVKVQPTDLIQFKFPAKPGVSEVFVMGNFNSWSRTGMPCRLIDDREWQFDLFMQPGTYEYKFVADGAEILDPANPDSLPNGLGGFNSILTVGDPEQADPGFFVKQTAEILDDRTRLIFDYLPNHESDVLDSKQTWVMLDNRPLPSEDWVLDGNRLSVSVNAQASGLLRIGSVNTGGQICRENHTILEDARPIHPQTGSDNWHFAVIYNIMVDRFRDGNHRNNKPVRDDELHPLTNFMGGDLTGIREAVEEGYFQNLGVNTLWITPIADSPDDAWREYIPPQRKFTGYHGYWPSDPRKIDKRFGDAKGFRKLVQSAHEKELKVLLDFVSNHVHEEHPYFRKHREWFGELDLPDGSSNLRLFNGETMLTTWFDTFLPSFDYASQEAVDAVVADAVYWMEEYRLDGFRQDATKHVPHAFWKQLNRELRRSFPDRDFYQIGESFGSNQLIGSFVNPGELDSQFNFSIYFPARTHFAGDNVQFINLNRIIRQNLEFFQPVNLMGTITSSHDQVRFMGFADGRIAFDENGVERAFTDPPAGVENPSSYMKLFMFTAMNISLPGVPVIYYGEEIGQVGVNDPDNRRMMRFDENLSKTELDFRNRMSNLVKLRNEYPALALGDLIILYEDPTTTVWLKQYFDEQLLVVFHNSPQFRTVDIPVDPFWKFRRAEALLWDTYVKGRSDVLTLRLSPYQTNIFKLTR